MERQPSGRGRRLETVKLLSEREVLLLELCAVQLQRVKGSLQAMNPTVKVLCLAVVGVVQVVDVLLQLSHLGLQLMNLRIFFQIFALQLLNCVLILPQEQIFILYFTLGLIWTSSDIRLGKLCENLRSHRHLLFVFN